jgi:hypothetical protein
MRHWVFALDHAQMSVVQHAAASMPQIMKTT